MTSGLSWVESRVILIRISMCLEAPLRSVVRVLSRKLDVPLRHHSLVVRCCGSFYGQLSAGEPWLEAISVEALLQILSGLQDGFTEIGCRPGLGNDIDATYLRERQQEVAVTRESGNSWTSIELPYLHFTML